MRRPVALVLMIACLLTGCSSAIDGRGSVAGSDARRNQTPTSAGPSSSAPPIPARFRRAPASSTIGDPPTANMCMAVGIAPFRALGLTATLSDYQIPPGCTVYLAKGGAPIGTVAAFGEMPDSHPRAGGTAKTRHGLRVISYRYDKSDESCEREIVARGVDLDVYAFARTGKGEPVSVTPYICRSADAMTEAIASAVANRVVPRLPLARPSVSELDFCEVLRADAPKTQPGFFIGVGPTVDGVADGCVLASTTSDIYLDFAVLGFGRFKNPKLVTIDGHQLEIGEDNTATYCVYTAPQQSIGNGFTEAVTLTTAVMKPDGAATCDQSAHLLATFLTTAGLR